MRGKVISVILCCRNEGAYINRCLDSLINQKDVDGNYEILVLDGMSDDSTREIIFAKMKQTNKISFFDNEKKAKVFGINIGFRNAEGEFLVICDGHAIYGDDFLSNLLKLIREHPEADCVGGPALHMGENSFAKAAAAAMTCRIGVGNPTHRLKDYEGYGDMSSFPLFRRKVLDDVGYYDEDLIINHDEEYCFRLKENGGKVYLSPKVKSYYFVRKNPFRLFYQYFTYGLYKVPCLLKHKKVMKYRHLVPALFYTVCTILLIADMFMGGFPFSVVLPGIYLAVLSLFGLKTIKQKGFKIGFQFPVAVFIIHLSYATGFFYGLIHFNFIHSANHQ